MAIQSKHLETLEAVIATALNIVKNRPLADLYVRRDFTGDFRIRVQKAGNATSSQLGRNDNCLLGRMTPSGHRRHAHTAIVEASEICSSTPWIRSSQRRFDSC